MDEAAALPGNKPVGKKPATKKPRATRPATTRRKPRDLGFGDIQNPFPPGYGEDVQ
jgi:hypothetical protein